MAASAVARLAGDPWLRWLLDTARTRLRTDIAWISEFDGDQQVVRAATGDLAAMHVDVGMATPLAGSFCVRVLTGQLPPVVTAAGRDPRTRDLPVTAQLGIGSYVGAPVHTTAGGPPVGMLCCLGRDDGAQLDRESARFVEFLAELVGEHLRRGEAGEPDTGTTPRERVAAVLRERTVQPVFQPVVELDGGRVVSYEALARFSGADPERVFGDALRAGLSVELEELAARTALAAARDRPHEVRVAVNLSPAALLTPSVLDMVLAAAGDGIGVEITEHARVDDYAGLLRARRLLREAGVTVSIDDTGSGYSSLQHVLRLEPDVIKLDAALVSGVDRDPAKQALVAAMQTFAGEVGVRVVAEGVETAAERDALAARGVRYGQGFLFGRPEPFGPAGVSR
ncbi:sensor domain-containing phosphodiesterase [Blastococcus sp. SYSU D00820]